MPKRRLQRISCVLGKKLKAPEARQIVANIGWLTLDRLVRMLLGLIVGIWVARYLGPEQFGLYSYAIAFISIFGVVATLGLDSIVVRDLIDRPSEQHRILGTTFSLRLLAGISIYLLIFISSYFIHSDHPITHSLISILSIRIIFGSWDVIDYWFQSKIQSKYAVYAKSAAFVLVSFLKIILIALKAPLEAFAWAFTIEIVVSSIGLTIVYLKKGVPIANLQYCHRTATQLMKDSAPLILSGVMIMIYMRIDQVMLTQMVDSKEVGMYSAAVRLTESWYFIPGVVVTSIFPNLLETRSTSDINFHKKLQSLYNVMSAIAYAIAIPTTLLSNQVISIFFGLEYANAGPMLSILIWSILFVNLGVARSSFLTAMNWTHLHLLAVTIGGVGNILLNFILIPRYGGIGASFSTVVSYGFAAYVSCFLMKKLRKTGFMLTKSIFLLRW